MIRKTCPRLGMPLLILLPLLLGCPFYYSSYRVYYDGNGNTRGYPPVDSKVYFPGDTAAVLGKPADMEKRDLEFLGWRRAGGSDPLQEGDPLNIGYEDVWLYAWWKDDTSPYSYIDDPGSGGVSITQYNQYDGMAADLVIPETLDGKPVTGIGEGAFAGAYLTGVALPAQLQVIGNKAFAELWLEELVIPDAVRSIGKLAFQHCPLETLVLGSGLESIDDYAFDGCRLGSVFLPEKVKLVGEGAFAGNTIVSIKIGADVTIKSNSSMGNRGAAFLAYYQDSLSRAGVYLFEAGGWTGPYE
jgi:hypothetical protein